MSNTIELTETEATLRQILLDVAKYIDETPIKDDLDSAVTLPKNLSNAKLELRFTGGWVRDKLLAVGSHDIDVAINKMTGIHFGQRMREYLDANAEKYGRDLDVSDLHKIEANPEKSKHLETVTTKIMGIDLDLVNLRKETYTAESRNPQIEFGTPEEDALRRDATVNAMFYNLGTAQIEDFTGKGFDDMKLKIMRTPLEPYQTFKDDPLRVLRLIRFASRLNYSIDVAAEEAMRDEDIREQLQNRNKISRERIGVEMGKMLRGGDPRLSLALIHRLGLYDVVYIDPTRQPDGNPEVAHLAISFECLSRLLKDSENKVLTAKLIRNEDDKYLAWLLSSLIPYAELPDVQLPKNKTQTQAQGVAREGLQCPNKVCDIVALSVTARPVIQQTVDKFNAQRRRIRPVQEGEEDYFARDFLGMAIRRWGKSWRSQVLFAMLHEISNAPDAERTILDSYSRFIDHVYTLGIEDAHDFKTLIDGKQLMKALAVKPGPWMQETLDVVMAWQLAHPDITDPEAAIDALRPQLKEKVANAQEKSQRELPSRLARHFLSQHIRPIFAQTKTQRKHAAVTATGHRNTRELPPPGISMSDMDDADAAKKWKQQEDVSLDLLRWSLTTLDADGVERNWPLLLPPVMTLLDDLQLVWKTKGVGLLNILLQNTTPKLLKRTGLGDIFEKELFPLFTYLPSLTPEDESIDVLNALFPALLTLTNIQYPLTSKINTEILRKREAFLDKILRQGILQPFFHAGEHVRVAETLLTHLIPLLNELQIASVKHLKNLLPLISNILSDPLGPAYPPLQMATTKALQVIVVNGWPRMAANRSQVLHGITLCWLRLDEAEGNFDDLRKELRTTVDLLKAAVGEEADLEADFTQLIAADQRLKALFHGV